MISTFKSHLCGIRKKWHGARLLVEVIPRSWSATRSSIGYMHWNTSNTCPEVPVTEEWWATDCI
jgi:hypothetical protein